MSVNWQTIVELNKEPAPDLGRQKPGMCAWNLLAAAMFWLALGSLVALACQMAWGGRP